MTSYNIAVTVCPVIFRPRVQRSDELSGVSTFYDAFIRMIENYHYLFDADDRFCNQANPVPRPEKSREKSGDTEVGAGSVEAIGSKLVLPDVFASKEKNSERHESEQ